MQLSLLGYDSLADYETLFLTGRGRRVATSSPDESLLLRKASGRLLAGLKRYQSAAANLEIVHARRTTDGEVSYYLGIGYDGSGRDRDAINAYEEAMRTPAYRASAAMRLGELRARQGALPAAEKNLAISLATAPQDLRAAEEIIAVKRAKGAP